MKLSKKQMVEQTIQLPEIKIELLNERPEGMSRDAYKANQVYQKLFIKRRKKGIIVWASNGIGDTQKRHEEMQIGKNGRNQKIYSWIKRPMGTFTGVVKNLSNI